MFFYNRSTQVAASGKLDAAGDYMHLKTFPAGQFNKAWRQIVPLGCGMLFFYDEETGNAATGRLDAVGDYTNLKDFPATQFGKSWTIVPVDGSRLFFYNSATGAAKTGRFDSTGNYFNLKDFPPGQFGTWTSIVSVDGGAMFFYNADWNDETGTQAAYGKIDSAGNYAHLKDFQVGQFGKWSSITSLIGRWLLFYTFDGLSFFAGTGKLDASGNYTHVKDVNPGMSWQYILPVEGQNLFFYRDGTDKRAASGRIDSTGDVKRRDFGAAFGSWSVIAG